MPNKIDITQVLVDIKRFERACIWTKFHHGKDDKDTQNEQTFKKNKTNLPQKYTVPEDLNIFLNAVKSEISDPRNRFKKMQFAS